MVLEGKVGSVLAIMPRWGIFAIEDPHLMRAMIFYIRIERPRKSNRDRHQPGFCMMRVKNTVTLAIGAASFLVASAMFALLFSVDPAIAVEQCRFIQTKPEREACYQRQEAELAAKRKPEASRESKTMGSLEQMKHEDEALNRQLHSICRGC
jgi:hypothetical protein